MGIAAWYQGTKYKGGIVKAIPSDDPIGDALRAACLGYWTLNETNGTRVDSKDGLDLVPSGTVASGIGKIGNALILDVNSPGLLIRQHITTLDLSHNYGVSLWIKLASRDIYQTLFDITSEISEDQIVQVNWNSFGSSLDFSALGLPGFFLITPDVGVWYHIVGWLNRQNNMRSVYVNAVSGTPSSGGVNVYSGDLTIHVGDSYYAPDAPSNGSVDEIGIFDLGAGDFTQDQIDYLYNSGAGRALFP